MRPNNKKKKKKREKTFRIEAKSSHTYASASSSFHIVQRSPDNNNINKGQKQMIMNKIKCAEDEEIVSKMKKLMFKGQHTNVSSFRPHVTSVQRFFAFVVYISKKEIAIVPHRKVDVCFSFLQFSFFSVGVGAQGQKNSGEVTPSVRHWKSTMRSVSM